MRPRIAVLEGSTSTYEEELERGFVPKNPGDAGIDLRAAQLTNVPYGQTVAIPLGVALQMPEGTVGWLTGRSSTVLSLGLLTHEGKIDAGYRGEVHAIVTALTRGVTISEGERVAQLVLLPLAVVMSKEYGEWEAVDRTDLEDSARGSMGLGSTGRR